MRLFAPVIAATLSLGAPALAQDIEAGQQLYTHYCATCHGATALGNGPMSPNLVIQPPDLTTLAERNGGVFPIVRTVTRIDGRDPLVAHGSPMPVFGDYFEGRGVAMRTPAGQPIMTSEPIVDLVTWLQTIQK